MARSQRPAPADRGARRLVAELAHAAGLGPGGQDLEPHGAAVVRGGFDAHVRRRARRDRCPPRRPCGRSRRRPPTGARPREVRRVEARRVEQGRKVGLGPGAGRGFELGRHREEAAEPSVASRARPGSCPTPPPAGRSWRDDPVAVGRDERPRARAVPEVIGPEARASQLLPAAGRGIVAGHVPRCAGSQTKDWAVSAGASTWPSRVSTSRARSTSASGGSGGPTCRTSVVWSVR